MARGRPRAPGKVYYLGRLRFRPGIDPPDWRRFWRPSCMPDQANEPTSCGLRLQGGAGKARQEANSAEDSRTRDLLDEMFSQF